MAFFLVFFFAFFLAFFLAFFFTLRFVFFLAFFLAFFLVFFLAFFFTVRFFFLAVFFLAARFLGAAFFLRTTLRFFATFRFEAFLRDFFLVAIHFLRVGYPGLSIYNKIKKSSKLSEPVNILESPNMAAKSDQKRVSKQLVVGCCAALRDCSVRANNWAANSCRSAAIYILSELSRSRNFSAYFERGKGEKYFPSQLNSRQPRIPLECGKAVYPKGLARFSRHIGSRKRFRSTLD